MLRTAAFCVLFGLISIVSAASAERLAMVIGNANYSGLPPQRTAAADSELIARALDTTGFDVTLLRDLTGDQLAVAVDKFSEAVTKDAIVVFYYAGHGLMIKGGHYLVPVDAEPPADVPAVPLTAVIERLRKEGTNPLIAFFDAFRQAKVAGSDRQVRPLPNWIDDDSISSNLVVGFATAPGDVTFDTGSDHSAYAEALANVLPQPGLSIGDMLLLVRQKVSDATAGQQNSWDQSNMGVNIVAWEIQK